MAIHLASRLHALLHGLFRQTDEAETVDLFDKVSALFEAHGLHDAQARAQFINELTIEVLLALDVNSSHPQVQPVSKFIGRMLDYEELFILPEFDWAVRHSVTEYWVYRDLLNVQKAHLEKFEERRELLRIALIQLLRPIYEAAPGLLRKTSTSCDITIPINLTRSVGNIAENVEGTLSIGFDEELADVGLLRRFAKRLERNLIAASGGNPDGPENFNKAIKMPTKSDVQDPDRLVETYLGGTPLHDFWDQTVSFSIPTAARFEHHHIIAGSGHGKTQTLQYLIGKDLEAVAAGERSVVVLDSQGDLIRNITSLAEFGPNGALHDRIVLIDPTDVQFPVSLNLFDVGMERLEGYAPLERERLTNSILELYDFVLGTLLSA